MNIFRQNWSSDRKISQQLWDLLEKISIVTSTNSHSTTTPGQRFDGRSLFPLFARPGSQVGAIIAHPKMARAALKKEAALLVYPGRAKDLFRPYAMRN